jgi:hypothetical protein
MSKLLTIEGYLSLVRRGGAGSGHFGHEGRPGEVGGSQPSDFHSLPGKKAWGRPAKQGDGTTMVDGKRTFMRGWDQEALDALDAWRPTLEGAKKKESWLSDLHAKELWRSDIARDFYADYQRIQPPGQSPLPPIETVLPALVAAVQKMGDSTEPSAEIHTRAGQRASHFLDSIEDEDPFIGENRTNIVLGTLMLALDREAPDPATWYSLGRTVKIDGSIDYDSAFMQAVDEPMRSAVAQVMRGVYHSQKEAVAVKFAADERALDFGLTEQDWDRWDTVMSDMRKAESVRKTVASHDSQLPYALQEDQKTYAARLAEGIAEREALLESGDPDRARLDAIEKKLNGDRKIFTEHQSEVAGVAVRVMREDLKPLFNAFSDEPRPETVPLKLIEKESPSPDYEPFSEAQMPDARTHLELAKNVLSTIVAPELLEDLDGVVVGRTTGPLNDGGQFNSEIDLIAMGNPSYSTMAHESIHGIENRRMSLRKLGWMFYRHRAGGDRTQFLAGLVPQRPDRFADPYTGRTYPDTRYQSEVLSTAAGQLALNPAMLAAADPELFNFAITALKGDWLRLERE